MAVSSVPTVQAQGITLPAGFAEVLVTSGITAPTLMTFAPDGRLFVSEQGGKIRIIENGVLLPTPFLSLNVDSSGARGLFGVTFDPDFANTHYVYVYYTVPGTPAHNRVSRFSADGNVALAGSELVLLDLNDLTSATNHNGGAMHFGSDGKLYVAVGENATPSNAQNMGNLLGKMLRLNPDGSIPTDNPFYNTATGQNRLIWALGLRHPYTFAFQNGTGRMFINDVGNATWEEIDDGIAGSNYGWPTTEGITSNPLFRSPLYAYHHFPPCAITGGDFYNPAVNQFPASYVGKYFFADYCARWIRLMDPSTNTATDFATNTPDQVVDLHVDSSGSLFILTRSGATDAGAVYKITYTAGVVPPGITLNPTSQIVPVGESVPFSCAGQGSIPLTYQWQRNTVDIPNATSSTYTLPAASLADDGATFRCIVSNSAGSTPSNDAVLTVIDGHRPDAEITLPTVGTTYQASETITYSGSATDMEDGVLSASAYTWEVVFHHETHIHPYIAPHSGVTSDSFNTDVESHGSVNIWYRIHLTVIDSTNLTRSVYVDVHPETVQMRFESNPPGLQITLDGQPHKTNFNWPEVVGATLMLEALTPQLANGTTWVFKSWSDDGAAQHSLIAPSVDTTYSAVFLNCPVVDTSTAGIAPVRNVFTTDTPTLTWTGITWAAGYQVQVDDNPDFQSPVYDNDQIPSSTLFAMLDSLPDCGYYWRVRAKNAAGQWGTWSPARFFQIDTP